MPWFVFGVTLFLSIVASWYVDHANRARAKLQFSNLVTNVRDDVTDAVSKYVTALQGSAALFNTFGIVTPVEFHSFVGHVDVRTRYPGIRLIAFAPRISAADLPAFVSQARRDDIPDYAIWPAKPPRAEYLPVRYQEPYSALHHAAMGHDLSTDPFRMAALQQACDQAAPAVSGKVQLSQTIGPGPEYGFIIFAPIYRHGVVPATVAERRADVVGYTFAVFSADEFFRNVLNPASHQELSLRVYSGEPSHDSILYDSDARRVDTGSFVPRLRQTINTPLIGGQHWTMIATERRRFDAAAEDRLPPLIFLGGAGISFALFAVTRGLANAQAASERYAADLLLAGRALRASQARLRRLVESNLIGVLFCDATGGIADANDEFLRIIGLSRSQLPLRSLTLQSITPPEFHAEDELAMSAVRSVGVGPSYEKELLRPNGTRIPVLIGMARVDGDHAAEGLTGAMGREAATADVAPQPAGASSLGVQDYETVAFAIDITQRRLAERELRQAKEIAERANRSKDQFLAVLSHELRTPLTPVLAAAAVARHDLQRTADSRELFAMIHRNVELEARLIDDLLDLTRVSRGKLQLHMGDVDLHQVMTHAADVCDPEELNTRRLTIRCEFRADQHHVRGDPARLQQVFWNLVKNAVKFTPVCGTITLSTRNEPAGPQFGAGDRPAVVADVTDTGIGIEPEVLAKVFDAFEQGSAARAEASGGLGLGLAISRGLVAGHGGAITAASAGRNQGATFTVRLLTIPAPQPATPASLPPTAPDRRSQQHLSILLVEDHLDTARIMSRLLRSTGHRVQLAHSVADALRLAAEQQFELLVSDLGLPDGTGMDVIRSLRNQPTYAHLHAIALTGYGTDDDIRQSLAAGFQDHLTKPINFDALRERIDRAVERLSRGEELPVGNDGVASGERVPQNASGAVSGPS